MFDDPERARARAQQVTQAAVAWISHPIDFSTLPCPGRTRHAPRLDETLSSRYVIGSLDTDRQISDSLRNESNLYGIPNG
jgi:hypothetical protein